MTNASASATVTNSLATPHAQRMSTYVFALFFILGSITSLNDVLVPKLKHLFSLSYTEAMLVQSSFFLPISFSPYPQACSFRESAT